MDAISITQHYLDMALNYLPTILMAIITLLVGFWIIGLMAKGMSRWLQKTNLDITLQRFLSSLFSTALKVMLLLSVVSMFGVNTTSFIAILSALMVGIGMAFNGTIGQLASGIMLMIFKPFQVGELVTIGTGHTGTVEAINAFNTTLRTLDNKRIIVSNANVTGNDMVNISGQGVVGVELAYTIDYNASIDEARQVIMQVGSDCPYILSEPTQGVVVGKLKDHGVELNSRPFCKSEHYWDTYFYMQENVKKAFDNSGIKIPYNRMVVDLTSK